MKRPPPLSPAQLRDAARDGVDHEMCAILTLHMRMRPAPAGAMHTAYAAHARNLIEFFRERTPQKNSVDPGTATFSLYLPASVMNPFLSAFPEREQRLWFRATWQVSHISGFRTGPDWPSKRWTKLKDWGSKTHRDIFVPKVQRALDLVPESDDAFPKTTKAFDLFAAWEASQP